MALPALNTRQWTLFAAVVLVVGLWFIWPFVSTIALSALMAWVFYPAYLRAKKLIRSPGLSAATTLFFSALVVLIPAVIVVGMSILQLTQLATDIGAYVTSDSGAGEFISSSVDAFNAIAGPVLSSGGVDSAAVLDFFKSTIPAILESAASFLISTVSNVPLAIVLLIMYITLFMEFLVYGPKLVKLAKELSPLGEESTGLYIRRAGMMANAMVKGQLLIAFVAAVIAAFLLIFLGLGDYFFFMIVIFTMLNLVPMGAGIVIYPIIAIAILAGNVVPGLIILVVYTITSNVDVLIRPRVIPKSIQLSAGITMVAAFAGLAHFGLIGVVYGPIITILLLTSLDIYKRHHRAAA